MVAGSKGRGSGAPTLQVYPKFTSLVSARTKAVLNLDPKEGALAEEDDEDGRDSYALERTLTLAAPGSQEKAPPRPPKAITLEPATASRALDSPALAMRATSNDDWCDSNARTNMDDSLILCLVSTLWTASLLRYLGPASRKDAEELLLLARDGSYVGA